MGLLELLGGKNRRRTETGAPKRRRGERGRGKTPTERMALMEARYLNSLRRERPEEFRKLMRRRVERQLGVAEDDGELSQLARTVGQLKEMGLINGLGSGGNGESWIKDAIDGLRMLVRYQQPTIATPPSTNGTVHVTEVPSAAAPLPAPTPTVAPAPPPVATVAPPPPMNVAMTPASAYLISQLENKSPAEAAAWLANQKRDEAQQFITALCCTPDVEHAALLDRMALEAPDMAGFVVWVRQRPELLAATVQELRIRTQQFPATLHPTQNVGM